MFDLDSTRRLVDRELGAVIDRADALDDAAWRATIAWLPGWTVTELLDHVGRAANQQAEAFENVVVGSQDLPVYPHPVGADRATIGQTLHEGRERFVAAIDQLTAAHLGAMTPLPFGLVPTPVALQIGVLEYAYHRWDLEQSIGNDGYALPADIALQAFEFLGGLLPMLAAGGTPPSTPLAFALEAPGATLVLESTGEGWAPAVAPTVGGTCVIAGEAGDLALFGMGRIGADRASLAVAGTAPTEAKAFKDYFPGP